MYLFSCLSNTLVQNKMCLQLPEKLIPNDLTWTFIYSHHWQRLEIKKDMHFVYVLMLTVSIFSYSRPFWHKTWKIIIFDEGPLSQFVCIVIWLGHWQNEHTWHIWIKIPSLDMVRPRASRYLIQVNTSISLTIFSRTSVTFVFGCVCQF